MSTRTPFAASTDENNNQRHVNSSEVSVDKRPVRFFVAAKVEKARQLSSRLESEMLLSRARLRQLAR